MPYTDCLDLSLPVLSAASTLICLPPICTMTVYAVGYNAAVGGVQTLH